VWSPLSDISSRSSERPGALVALQPVGDGELANPLDALERGLAFLLADDVAEDPAEQADVVDERLVLLGAPLASRVRFVVMATMMQETCLLA
jgi:hypothetical protein